MNKLLLSATLLTAISTTALAQSGTNSPYSQYGLGLLSDYGTGFNRGMNGLGLGFHEHGQINYMNPASYSSLDSLSFIFDAGFSGQLTNFKENGVKKNAKNGVFDYVVAGFRAAKHVGVSFGVIPYSNIGYKYATTGDLNNKQSPSYQTYTNTFEGNGGLHQVYLGVGWQPFTGLSIGANIAYLWGNYTRSVVNSYSDAYVNTISKYYTATVNNYKLDFGVQYTARLSKKDELTIGATYGLGHKLDVDPECRIISNNSQTNVSDTTSLKIKNGLELPTTFGGGLMFNHNNKLKVGVDYSLMQFGKVGYPEYTLENGVPKYVLSNNIYKDRHKLTLGAEFCPNEKGRKFSNRFRYRLGASYATPYYKVNGVEGPKEYGVSVGLGIPVINEWNNRSILNISGSWVRQEAPGLIKENTFRINIGFTFNERWFAKWKVE